MNPNLHSVDRIIRLLLAVIVAVLYMANIISGTSAIVLGIAAIILIVTAFISFCPLYYVFGINTRKKLATR
jgi:hypothetical protein